MQIRFFESRASKFRYLAILVGMSIVTYLRYPVYLETPNFYAEDGTEFFQNVNSDGLLSIFYTFNGYPIVGVRLMANFGYYSSLFPITKNLQATAISFALVSYLFWSLLSLCTWIVLRKYVSNSLSVLGSSLVLLTPLNGWNYAILGTLGNLKFGFVFLAFLLLLDRWKINRWTKFNQSMYVLCFLTNPMSIIFLPGFIFSFDRKRFSINVFEKFFLGVLSAASLFIIYCAKKYPLPSSYREGGWDISQLVEITLGRTIFFPFTSSIYQGYSGVLLVLLTLSIACILCLFPSKNLKYFTFGVIASLTVSLVVIYSRGGINIFYNHYSDPGPAQFFYPQNMMVVTSLIILVGGWRPIIGLTPRRLAAVYALFAVLFMAFNIRGIGFNGLGENGKWQTSLGNVSENLKSACEENKSGDIKIPILPGPPWEMTFPHDELC